MNRDLDKELDVLIQVFQAQERDKMVSRLEKVKASDNPYTKRIHIWLYKRFTPVK